MTLEFTGEKTIMINQISGVQVKKVGLSRENIQFIMAEKAKSVTICEKIAENII